MTTLLSPNPSVENLRKRAKTLKKAWQKREPAALQRIRTAHPQYRNASDEQLLSAQPRLADCQLVLAREYGFDSWPQLRVAVASAGASLPDEFVTLACLCYDDPHYDHRSFHVRAHDILRKNRWLSEANIWCAAAAGNATAAKALLDADPNLVNRPGPHGWVPLICACYSRVKPLDLARSTFEVARLLLDRGADPNAYTMKGNADERLDQTARRFTALAGLFGGGSTGLANQPPHPHRRELAELLLERGADPADDEALRINLTFGKLEVLLKHGLRPDASARRANGEGVTLMGRALSMAARGFDAESVELLLAHRARADETFQGKTPWQHAIAFGHLEIARLLENAGAPTSKLDELEQFVSLCLAADESGAKALLACVPDLLRRAPKGLVLKAVNSGRAEAVNLTLDLGFDPNYMDEVVALHSAAGAGKEEIVRLLLKRGASLTIREPFYDGTPVAWADFFDQRRMRDILLNEGAICLFDALDFDRLDRVPDVLDRDHAALNRPFAQCISRQPRPEDWQTPLMRMVDRGKTEAVRTLLEHGADVNACNPDGKSLFQFAREKGFQEIARLLE